MEEEEAKRSEAPGNLERVTRLESMKSLSQVYEFMRQTDSENEAYMMIACIQRVCDLAKSQRLAQEGIVQSEEFQEFFSRVREKMSIFSERQFTTLLLSMNKLLVWDEDTFERVRDLILAGKFKGLNPFGLSIVLSNLAKFD